MTKNMLCGVLVAVAACTTTTTTRIPVSPSAPRGGTVDSIELVVQRTQGQPVAGAAAGALIGGFLFRGHGPGRLFGMAGGAALGAAASSGSSENRTFQVLVDFDDGERGMFMFRDFAPFRRGDRVTLTPNGLMAGG